MTEQKKKSGRPAGTQAKKGTKKRTKAEVEKLAAERRLKDEIWSVVMVAVGLFLAVALQTEAAGQLGVLISSLLHGLLGFIGYVLPYFMMIYGALLFLGKTIHINAKSITFASLLFLMLVVLNASFYLDSADKFTFKFFADAYSNGANGGGVFGMFLGLLMIRIIGKWGLYILCTVIAIVSAMLVLNTPVSQLLDFNGLRERRAAAKLAREEEDEILAEYEGRNVPVKSKGEDEEVEDLDEDEEAKKGFSIPSFLKDKAVKFFEDEPVDEVEEREKKKRVDQKDLSPSQLKIIDYMNDEELFEKGAAMAGFGLEDSSLPAQGAGLQSKSSGIHDFSDEIMGIPEAADPFGTVLGNAEGAGVSGDELFRVKKEKIKLPQAKSAEPTGDLKIAVEGKVYPAYKMPSIDLLSKVSGSKNLGEQATLQAKAIKLEETLRNFGVNAKVLQVTKGPAVTRYEIQPNTGVKVSSIVRLADDIALNLEAKSIRMEAPIPGKAAVGIEVENERINMVSIREIVESAAFHNAKSKITFAVGKDIAGNAIVADLKSMPHLLIAGSTGSGKSVCINSLIISILYKAKPEEVKFVLIDPKVVELNNYNGIPHLLIPVVTEPSKAAAALNWAVAEMTDRYKKFAESGVRDLASYNDKVRAAGEDDKALPQIVVIIDELADLMMAAPSQVEEAICRLAQMARAAGMHLIVATQRPSVDIITGVIKANIPSRIAFAVSSQVDSRTILDMGGAEKLVGKGDMLFNPLGAGKPVRVQGCFISDTEVHNVIDFLKQSTPEPEYASDVIHSIEKVQTDTSDDDGDELLADAIETVVRAEQASASMLQRRFRIGYNRAARLIDMMEGRGIIGPQDGSRPRKVLLTLEELESMNAKVNGDEPVQTEMNETQGNSLSL